jgi:Na+/H+ ion antiporter subunit
MRRVASFGVGAIIAGAFYLLLIDTVDVAELCAMCGVVLLAAFAFARSRELGFPEASFRARWLRHAWRALLRIPIDIAIVCREAVTVPALRRPAAGEFRTVSFRGGGQAADHGRAALAELLGSLAPNTIVVGVDQERGLLLVHQLRRHGGRERLDLLRLG